MAPRKLKLEVDAQAKLHGAWSIALPWQRAETATSAGVEVVPRARIQEYSMVQKVHDDGLELDIEALRKLEVLPDAEIHAPVGEPAQNAPAAVPVIQTQNRLADLIKCSRRVSEQIGQLTWGLVDSSADMAHRDCVFRVPVPEEVDGVAFAECLAASVGRAEGNRQATARSENRCKGPAPEDMAKYPLLSGVEVRLVDKEQVVNEFTVKARQTVPPV